MKETKPQQGMSIFNEFYDMTDNSKLIWIKILQTIVWLFFNFVIFYLLYAVVVDKIDKLVWICIGLVLAEGAVLLVFKRVCPITILARRYSQSERENFDIYLPNWMARYNKEVYTSIFMLAILILLFRIFS